MNDQAITNDYDALVQALVLAVTAPAEEKAAEVTAIADQIAARMSEIEVARAKHQAEMILGEVPPF
jgi:hypothetical protein